MLFLPRHWAPLPLLVGACYMTLAQGIELGAFSFPVLRMLIVVGVLRVVIRGERVPGGLIGLDWLMVAGVMWMLASSMFHKDPGGMFVNNLGMALNNLGIYFLVRIACQDREDVVRLAGYTAFLLVPVALEMIVEHLIVRNLFATLGGVPPVPGIREGRLRAQGPFAHAILAGTVGAVTLPLMAGLWHEHRKRALLGMAACVVMVLACSSSGPIMSFLAGIVGLVMWRWRHRMRAVRWLLVLGYIALDIVMKAPAYYIIGRIDIVGGSTGWHRAALIESGLAHLHEWWLAGTDFTRHWMPTGVSWSNDHTDITNHYLALGVRGGLPLMLLFIALLVKAYSYIGQTLEAQSERPGEELFMIWALGAGLFAHTVTMISVSYFDQSFMFLYLTLGIIGSLWAVREATDEVEETSHDHEEPATSCPA